MFKTISAVSIPNSLKETAQLFSRLPSFSDGSTWQSLGVQASNHVGHIIGRTLGKDSAAYSYHGRKKNGSSSRSTMVKDSTGR